MKTIAVARPAYGLDDGDLDAACTQGADRRIDLIAVTGTPSVILTLPLPVG
ncbi:hypothetical protein BRAS3843_910005 [Bradyrhizobium sp. STM 3843]|nr:hypothetical protein BRAS3843_910005 [Bradyrhizobium sp. STM 3843]